MSFRGGIGVVFGGGSSLAHPFFGKIPELKRDYTVSERDPQSVRQVEANVAGGRSAASFEQLCAEQREELMVFVTALVADFHLAEDIVQAALAVAHRKRHEYREGTNFGAWLRAIARMVLLKEIHQKKRPGMLSLDESTLARLEAHWLAQAQRRPEWSAELAALGECLGGLAPEERKLLELRYELGLSAEEISRRTARGVSAVNTALSRLRQRLRERITAKLRDREG